MLPAESCLPEQLCTIGSESAASAAAKIHVIDFVILIFAWK